MTVRDEVETERESIDGYPNCYRNWAEAGLTEGSVG
jgi:hypothetical protein